MRTTRPWADKYLPALEKLEEIIGPGHDIRWDDEVGMFYIGTLRGMRLTPEVILEGKGIEDYIKSVMAEKRPQCLPQ